MQEITHEFSDLNQSDINNEVLSVKFDESDKYIGASYTNGTIRIINAFTGKVITTFNNNFNPIDDVKAPIT